MTESHVIFLVEFILMIEQTDLLGKRSSNMHEDLLTFPKMFPCCN